MIARVLFIGVGAALYYVSLDMDRPTATACFVFATLFLVVAFRPRRPPAHEADIEDVFDGFEEEQEETPAPLTTPVQFPARPSSTTPTDPWS